MPPLCRYKYIYIRSPKAASTSIVDEFGECNNVRTHGFNASTCMGMHSSWEHFFKDPRNITDMWRDYYVFGFVRNPWNRAYSLYKYMQSDGCMKKCANAAYLRKFACMHVIILRHIHVSVTVSVQAAPNFLLPADQRSTYPAAIVTGEPSALTPGAPVMPSPTWVAFFAASHTCTST
jgi:hypothetical protein